MRLMNILNVKEYWNYLKHMLAWTALSKKLKSLFWKLSNCSILCYALLTSISYAALLQAIFTSHWFSWSPRIFSTWIGLFYSVSHLRIHASILWHQYYYSDDLCVARLVVRVIGICSISHYLILWIPSQVHVKRMQSH